MAGADLSNQTLYVVPFQSSHAGESKLTSIAAEDD